MGSICRRNNDLETKEDLSQTILNHSSFDGLSFEFTTDRLHNIDNNCLLIFSDGKRKLRYNQYLCEVSENVSMKV